MATLHASGVPEDSHLRDPSRIPFPDSLPATQNPTGPVDEEEMDNLRELVEQIDAHVEVIGMEATSNLPTNNQSGENAQYQPPVPKHQPSEMATRHNQWTLPFDHPAYFVQFYFTLVTLQVVFI